MRPRLERVKELKNEVMIGVHLDKEVFVQLDEKTKELGSSKEKYVRELILKDLGLTFVPGHYKKL